MAERINVKIEGTKDLARALKTWKNKSFYITNDLKNRKEYEKPSVKKRKNFQKAVYLLNLSNGKQ